MKYLCFTPFKITFVRLVVFFLGGGVVCQEIKALKDKRWTLNIWEILAIFWNTCYAKVISASDGLLNPWEMQKES